MDAERTSQRTAQGKGKDHKLKIKYFIYYLFVLVVL